MQYRNIYLIDLLVALTSLLAFSIVTIIPSAVFYLVFLAAVVFITLFFKKWYLIDKKLFKYFGLFLIPSLIGLFSYPISMILEGNLFDYNQLSILGRVANLIFLFLFFLILDSYLKTRNLILPFRWYWVGAGLLMITALWQFVDVFLHLTHFPFETRAHLHSTYGAEFSFSKRLTGIAREPSYFVMLAIDFIILTVLFSYGVKRLIILGISLLLMLLSLSPSGYITFAGAFTGAYLFTRFKYISLRVSLRSVVIFILTLFLLPFTLYIYLNLSYFDYFNTRITDPKMWESARAYMSYMPFYWSWESNPFSFLFGHGIKSYSIIGTAFNVPSGEPVHITSNNFYVDTFWESGLIGLVLIVIFFILAFINIFRSRYSKLQVFVAFFILFDLIFSSMFRADFASFRYFILLYLIYILINYDLRLEKGFYV